jgi:hypothetical protein
MKVHLTVVAITSLVVACGGNVVVDGPTGAGAAPQPAGPGGATGTSGTSGSTTGSGAGGAGGGSCFPADLTPCGTPSFAQGFCHVEYCQADMSWEAICTNTYCTCLQNTVYVCTCDLATPGDVCAGVPDCCFPH